MPATVDAPRESGVIAVLVVLCPCVATVVFLAIDTSERPGD
jgi:hypothetical protein